MSRGSHTLKLLLAFAAVYLIWGSTYAAMKVVVQYLPPILMGAIRFTSAGLLLLGIEAALGRVKREWLMDARYWRFAFITGGLMLAGANGMLAFALRLIPSGTAALVIACTPVWLVLFDRIQMRRGMPPWKHLAGLALGILGVVILSGVFGGSHSHDAAAELDPRRGAWGILMATFSTLCWALGSILGRRAPQPKDLLVGASMQMIAGGVLMILLSAMVDPWSTVPFASTPLSAWLSLIYLVLAGSICGFSAFVWLMQNTSAARASTYAYVNPLVALLLGWVLLGEIPGDATRWAAPVIILGVILLQSRASPRAAAQALVSSTAPGAVTPRSTSPADGEPRSRSSTVPDRSASSR